MFAEDWKKVKEIKLNVVKWGIKQIIKPRKKENRFYQYFELLYSGTQNLLAFKKDEERKIGPFLDEQGIMRGIDYPMRIEYYRYSENIGFHKIA